MGLAHYTEEKLSVGKKLIPKGTIVLGNMFHIMNDPGYWQEPRLDCFSRLESSCHKCWSLFPNATLSESSNRSGSSTPPPVNLYPTSV